MDAFLESYICIQDLSFNKFDTDTCTIKPSVNEAQLTGLWARNYATTQRVLILKFTFGHETFPDLSRNGLLASKIH